MWRRLQMQTRCAPGVRQHKARGAPRRQRGSGSCGSLVAPGSILPRGRRASSASLCQNTAGRSPAVDSAAATGVQSAGGVRRQEDQSQASAGCKCITANASLALNQTHGSSPYHTRSHPPPLQCSSSSSTAAVQQRQYSSTSAAPYTARRTRRNLELVPRDGRVDALEQRARHRLALVRAAVDACKVVQRHLLLVL